MIAELPERFRAACHWRLYVGAICGPDGLPSTDIPKNAAPEVKLALLGQKAQVAKVRTALFPEDGDGAA